MDIWGVLALLFAGAFFGTLVLALFYWREVRPRLLALTPPPAPTASANGSAARTDAQLQTALQTLNDSLIRHSALLAQLPTSFEVLAPDLPEAGVLAERLHGLQAQQTRYVTALGELQNALTRETADLSVEIGALAAAQGPHGATLARLADEIAALKDAQGPFEDSLAWLQAEFVKLQGTQEVQGELRRALADQGALLSQQQSVLTELLSRTEALGVAQTGQGTRLTTLHHAVNEIASRVEATSAAQGPFAEALAGQQHALNEVLSRVEAISAAQGPVDAYLVQQRNAYNEILSRVEAISAAQGPAEEALTWLQAEFVKLQGAEEAEGQLRETLAMQGEALAELHALSTALTASGASLSEALNDNNEAITRLETSQFSLQARQEQLLHDSRRSLDDLHRLLAALNSGNLSVNAELTQHGDAIRRLETRQTRDEGVINDLLERINTLLAGQQTHTQLLDVLAQREPAVQTVIREERLVTQDRLTDIRGIGPVYAGRLHERGIHTFAQLAALEPGELVVILQAAGRRGGINPDPILEQAALLAGAAAEDDET